MDGPHDLVGTTVSSPKDQGRDHPRFRHRSPGLDPGQSTSACPKSLFPLNPTWRPLQLPLRAHTGERDKILGGGVLGTRDMSLSPTVPSRVGRKVSDVRVSEGVGGIRGPPQGQGLFFVSTTVSTSGTPSPVARVGSVHRGDPLGSGPPLVLTEISSERERRNPRRRA